LEQRNVSLVSQVEATVERVALVGVDRGVLSQEVLGAFEGGGHEVVQRMSWGQMGIRFFE
jgi:hypothetical protein